MSNSKKIWDEQREREIARQFHGDPEEYQYQNYLGKQQEWEMARDLDAIKKEKDDKIRLAEGLLTILNEKGLGIQYDEIFEVNCGTLWFRGGRVCVNVIITED